MEIRTVGFPDRIGKVDRISIIGKAIIDMGVKIPNIVGTLATMIEMSPYQGRVDLFDVGFHAHWEETGKGGVLLELTQLNMRI